MDYDEYSATVATQLGGISVSELEDIYGYMIRDCFDSGTSIAECIKMCNIND